MRKALAGTIVLAALAVAAPAHAGVSIDYAFDGCRWRSTADSGVFYQDAITETEDMNGGCRYIDADVRYGTGPGTWATKLCATTTSAWTRCWVESRPHHQSSSRASSWETDHWQVSGWWG